jgi:hypothetical protein
MGQDCNYQLDIMKLGRKKGVKSTKIIIIIIIIVIKNVKLSTCSFPQPTR